MKNDGLRNFLLEVFEFSDEEQLSIDKRQPMTQELFNSCIDKCINLRMDALFYRLLDEYPDFLTEYAKSIEEEIKDVELPERTPEQEVASWEQLCKRIREVYGEDAI